VVVLSLLASAYALNGIHCGLAPALHLAGRGALLPRFAAATAGLNLLLNLALVPVLGVAGAALSTLICFAALAAATFAAARRDLRLPIEENRIAKIILSAAIVVLATMRWPAGSSWTLISAHLGAALIGFPLVLSLSGFFRPQERQAVRRFFGLRPAEALQ
jgi:O-antigen/teichoic acid export membrane protein